MPKRKPSVLAVYKKDAYQRYILENTDKHFLALLKKRNPDVLDIRAAYSVHKDSFRSVVRDLHTLGVDVDIAYQGRLKVTKRYDLVVSIGGDGTFLEAARHVNKSPILGVNSDPSRSEAVYCAATKRTFANLCAKALAGKLIETRLHWIRLSLNGRVLPNKVLNEILVAQDYPGTMSRYRLRIGNREELQKSSGLWVATSSGSSSAIHSAGGKRLPWGSLKFQYLAREPYLDTET